MNEIKSIIVVVDLLHGWLIRPEGKKWNCNVSLDLKFSESAVRANETKKH